MMTRIFLAGLLSGVAAVRREVPHWTDNYGYCKHIKDKSGSQTRLDGLEDIHLYQGDTLVFHYSDNHDVWQHTDKASWDSCDFSTATMVANTHHGGNCPEEQEWNSTCVDEGPGYQWEAETAGTFYFSCSIGTHCQNGQKVTVHVHPADQPMPPHEMTVRVPFWTDDAGYCEPIPGLSPGNHRPDGLAPITLLAGQSLLFKYSTHHDVWAHPSREALEACDFSSAVLLAGRGDGGGCTDDGDLACIERSDGVLIKPEQDEVYLSCGVHDHCANGQRLVVTVVPISCMHGASSTDFLGFGWPEWADGLLVGNAWILILLLVALACLLRILCALRSGVGRAPIGGMQGVAQISKYNPDVA